MNQLQFPPDRERQHLSVPANHIDQSGQWQIRSYMAEHGMPELPYDWMWLYRVGGKGEYVGTFGKRLTKWLAVEKGYRIDGHDLNQICDLAARHCGRSWSSEYDLDFTQVFDWNPGEFGEYSYSCYWGSNSDALERLKSGGAWAVRFYRDAGYGERGYARAWLVPYKGGECMIVFNGYGMDDDGNATLAIARVLSSYWGNAYYRKVRLTNYEETDRYCPGLYINSDGLAYLIGPYDLVADTYSVDLELGDPPEPSLSCDHCGCRLSEDECYNNDDNTYCESCWSELYVYCDRCGSTEACADAVEWTTPSGDDRTYCERCADRFLVRCPDCNSYLRESDGHPGPDGDTYCADCAAEYVECEGCGQYVKSDDATEVYRDQIVPDDQLSLGLDVTVGICSSFGQFCVECLAETFTTCRCCGQKLDRRDAATAYDQAGDAWCGWCARHFLPARDVLPAHLVELTLEAVNV